MNITSIKKLTKNERDREGYLVPIYEITLNSGNTYEIKFGAYDELTENLDNGITKRGIIIGLAGDLANDLEMTSVDEFENSEELNWLITELPEQLGEVEIIFKNKSELKKLYNDAEEQLYNKLVTLIK